MGKSDKHIDSIHLGGQDVALVFRNDGSIDASFPQHFTEPIPDHVLVALALSYALVDEGFVEDLRRRFHHQQLLNNTKKACNDL